MAAAAPAANRQPDSPLAHHDRVVVERGRSLVIITIGIMLATLMQTLDTTIVNVALPIVQGNLGATLDEGAWVVTGYIISAVVVIPLTPWLQSRFGRRQYYGTSIIGFTIASIFCGTSSSIEQLIFWRIVQGLFGGGLVATAQATLRDTFPPGMLGISQAIFAMGALVGPSVGPTLGGWLTDNVSWNYVFFINVVPGTLAAIIIFTQLKNPTDPKPLPLDVIGLALLTIGLGSLQYILGEGQRNDWLDDPTIRFFSCTAVTGIIAFVFWELYGTTRPVVDLRAFRYRAIVAGSVLGLIIGAVLYGATVILPQFVQSVLIFTATLSGELIFIRALFIALLTIPIARLASSGKVPTQALLLTGFSCVAIAQIWLYFVTTTTTDFGTLLGPMILAGVGLSMVFTPVSIAVLGSLPPQVIPKAAAFQSLSLQLGGSLSTAALVTLIARRTAFHQEVLAQHMNLANPALSRALAGHTPISALYGQVLAQATTLAYADAQFALGILTFLLMPFVFVLPRRRKNAAPVEVPLD
jgi:DHA2 family multidrug resistance protein